jgi:hypothetical protein
MNLLARRSFFAVIAALFLVSAAVAQVTSVGTSGAGAASYGTTSQSGGPFPWTDLGFTASANINPGGLAITTGGATSFDLAPGTVTPSEMFTPGSTAINIGYTPGWSGSSILSVGSSGGFQSNFVYNIGPFNGSTNILNVPLLTPGSVTNLNSSLNAPVVNPPVINSQTVGGPGVGLSATLSAQAGICPLCATVASVSLNLSVGTQISQTIVAAPQATYGDLVWYSTSQTFPGVSHTQFVSGLVGNVMNTFAPPSPSSLGLSSGGTLYFNMLPVVMLNMPVTNDASVSVPASIGASWDIFGASGSTTFASGDLYTLDAGPDSVDFDGTWYDSQYYSIPLEYMAANPNCPPVIACLPSYETFPGSMGGGMVDLPTGGIPGNVIPPLTVNMPGGSTSGPGTTPNGPLFPNGNCPQASAAGLYPCATTITQTITPTPEPADGDLLFFGAGLFGIAGVLRRKLRA